MEFKFDFQVGHLERALSAARNAIDHPEELLGSIGESLKQAGNDRHNAGLAPDGSKWKELSPNTPKEGRRGGILAKTGRMLQSYQYHVASPTLILGFDGTTEALRAAWHHSGSKPYAITPKKAKALKFNGMYRQRVNHPGLPARPLVGFPASDQQLAGEVIGDYLAVILNRVR